MLQDLVDTLSAELERPVLFDDAALRPLAYSRQWGPIDTVRSESILSRGASAEVRRALFAQGIASARGAVWTTRVERLGMEERLCVPARHGGVIVGYLWLLDNGPEIAPDAVARAETVAARAAELVAARAPALMWLRDEAALLEALASPREQERLNAAAEVRARRLLPEGPYVAVLVGGRDTRPSTDAVLARLGARFSGGHTIAGATGDGVLLLISLAEPVLSPVAPAEIAARVHGVLQADVAVGQSAAMRGLESAPEARRQAAVALRVARARPGERAHAAWDSLAADRVLAQLPPTAAADVPPTLAALLRDDPVVAGTLAAFLGAAGDVKATATALNLHRSGVYYRLGRIEELTGLDLGRGEDRLLAHLALWLHGSG
jgi:hypothetical protein